MENDLKLCGIQAVLHSWMCELWKLCHRMQWHLAIAKVYETPVVFWKLRRDPRMGKLRFTAQVCFAILDV